jgi:hypothetical protein
VVITTVSDMDDHALAVTLAVALLAGGVLIGRELLGLWPVVALVYGPLLAVSCGPVLARRVVVEIRVHRLRRELRR